MEEEATQIRSFCFRGLECRWREGMGMGPELGGRPGCGLMNEVIGVVGLLRRGVGTMGRVAGEGGAGTLLSEAVPPRLTC